MRYAMKQQWLSLTDTYNIRDDAGQDFYLVRGEFFTIGARLSFQDMAGNELMYIKQRVLSWGPTYELYKDGVLCAEVRKALFTFFSCRFTVDVPGPDDMEAQGDLLDHEYTFIQRETPVAHVSKQWFSWSDTYGIDIAEGQDDILILASAVIIDLACHENNS
ncbi:MAG: LURP-one-related/scramblase family protein [Armatimonadota bacterium]